MSDSNFNKADVAMQQLLKQQNIIKKDSITNKEAALPFAPSFVGTNNQQGFAYAIGNPVVPVQRPIQTNNVPNASFPASVQRNFLAQSPFILSGPTSNQTTALPRTGGQIQQGSLNPTIYSKTIQNAQSRLIDVPKPRPEQKIITEKQIPVEQLHTTSKIQYIPFNRKVIQYQEKQVIMQVPKHKKVVQYRQQLVQDLRPRQVTKKDYYAVEHLRQYVAQYVPERRTNMVQRAVPFKRIEYVPVTREVYHGAPFGNQGVQNLSFCGGISGQLGGMHGLAGMGVWQNNINLSQISGTSLYQGGWLPTGCCDQFKTKFNYIYDSYDPYIPNFKY